MEHETIETIESALATTSARALLRSAAGRAITCPICGTILDASRTVLATAETGRCGAFCSACADSIVVPSNPSAIGARILDGRGLFYTPPAVRIPAGPRGQKTRAVLPGRCDGGLTAAGNPRSRETDTACEGYSGRIWVRTLARGEEARADGARSGRNHEVWYRASSRNACIAYHAAYVGEARTFAKVLARALSKIPHDVFVDCGEYTDKRFRDAFALARRTAVDWRNKYTDRKPDTAPAPLAAWRLTADGPEAITIEEAIR